MGSKGLMKARFPLTVGSEVRRGTDLAGIKGVNEGPLPFDCGVRGQMGDGAQTVACLCAADREGLREEGGDLEGGIVCALRTDSACEGVRE